MLIYDRKRGKAYSDLILSIQVNEKDLFNEEELITTLSLDFFGPIKEKFKWTVIENKVYDVSNLNHPLGKFILEEINQKDVTLQFYGLKSLKVTNSQNETRNLQHGHSYRSLNLIKNQCIGILKNSSCIKKLKKVRRKKPKSLEDIPTTPFKLLKDEMLLNWNVEFDFSFKRDTYVFYAKKDEYDHFIQLNFNWENFLGKFYLLHREDSKEVDYIYPIFSFSPSYIQKKFDWYTKININFKKELLNTDKTDILEIGKLFTSIEASLQPEQQILLQTRSDIRTFHLPFIYKKKKKQPNLFNYLSSGKRFSLSGSFGSGLYFNLREKTLFLIKDEGILPFLDFLEFYLQKALMDLVPDNPHPFFGDFMDIKKSLENIFSIYWEIS